MSFHTWHIPDGTHRSVKVSPAYRVDSVVGLWKDEALFTFTQKDNVVWTLGLVRVPYASMSVVTP